MHSPGQRRGRSDGAIAVALFLLSGLLVFPLLRRTFDDPPRTEPRYTVDASRFLAAESSTAGAAASSARAALAIKAWRTVADLPKELAQFETVFWEPRDTESMRAWIAETPAMRGARVLEIGSGTGLLTLCCAARGAAQIVATDINPQAVANTIYNAERLDVLDRIEALLVSPETPGPFSPFEPGETFDVILSNPPWEEGPVDRPAAHALYDPDFALLDGLLAEGAQRLNPGGRLMLAYGAREAIARIQRLAPEYGWQLRVLDDRDLDDLPSVFVPGMLLELTR